MLHYFVIETEREVDSAMLLDGLLASAPYVYAVPLVGGHVDHDAAAAERAIAKRDRAIWLLVENIGEQAGWFVEDVIDDLSDATSGFPADVIDTIRHVCDAEEARREAYWAKRRAEHITQAQRAESVEREREADNCLTFKETSS